MKYTWVHRIANGKIYKLTARPCGSEEQLLNNNPEVVAFRNPVMTKEEIYINALSNKVVKALIISLNNGSFIPGGNLPKAELKAFFIEKIEE